MVRKDGDLIGGRLCLDFVNTVSWRGTDQPRDNLGSYRDLVRWGVRSGSLSRADGAALRLSASDNPAAAALALARARELREGIYRLISNWKRGVPVEPADLALVNGSAPPRGDLVWHHRDFTWTGAAAGDLEKVLWPIVWSVADLLTAGERRRVGSCGSAACGWLFYDESRGERRRWCSMRDCGNRAKARRHYERTSRSSRH